MKLSVCLTSGKGTPLTANSIDASRTFALPFCGQRAQLADVIKLRRGTVSCTSLKWPQ